MEISLPEAETSTYNSIRFIVMFITSQVVLKSKVRTDEPIQRKFA